MAIRYLISPLRELKRRIDTMGEDARRRIDAIDNDARDLKREIGTHRKEADANARNLRYEIRKYKKAADAINEQLWDYINGNLLPLAELRFMQGDTKGAIVLTSRLLDDGPSNDEARFLRGRCYLKEGKRYSKEAIKDLELAVKAKEKDPERHLTLATAYFHAGLPIKAEREAFESLNLGIDNKLEARTIIGNARLAAKNYDGAIEVFKDCLTHIPAVIGYGKALRGKAGRASPKESLKICADIITHFTEAIKINPSIADYYTYRALAYAEWNGEGDWENALNDWEEAKTRAPEDSKPWEFEGDAIYQRSLSLSTDHQRANILRKVIKIYGEALKRAVVPYKPAIRNKRSNVYQVLGEFDVALKEAKAGTRENPHHVANFMSWASAAISAHLWKDVIEAANSGIRIADETKGRGGAIWCLLFRIIGRCGDHQSAESNMADCKRLVNELEIFTSFDPTKFDWLVTKQRLYPAMMDWPADLSSLTRDTIALVEKDFPLSRYQAKYIEAF
jgi:tetratricopeptide (TPR) repeat protein